MFSPPFKSPPNIPQINPPKIIPYFYGFRRASIQAPTNGSHVKSQQKTIHENPIQPNNRTNNYAKPHA